MSARPDPAPTRLAEVLTLAAQGVGKVDLWGSRGATLVSQQEIEAMALALACLGLRAIHPSMQGGGPVAAPRPVLRGPGDD